MDMRPMRNSTASGTTRTPQPGDHLRMLSLGSCDVSVGSGSGSGSVDGWWSAFLRSGIALRFMPDLVRRTSSFLRSSSTRTLGRV